MRILPMITCFSALTLLAACGEQEGYYDSNGNYVAPSNVTTQAQRNHAPSPGHSGDGYGHEHHDRYDRAGYYDYNGYYIAKDGGLNVPEDMSPPRGMCRVWFVDRVPANQPAVESCDSIKSRVPAGAYVIYGG